MKRHSFKQFLKEAFADTAEKKSIPHLDDLKVEEIISELQDFDTLVAREKMDGVALRFGIDESGNLYTSREAKGRSDRIYDPEDYNVSGASNVFKSGHYALLEVEDILKSLMQANDQVDIEIIYGDQPNTVIYGLEGKSYIVFLSKVGQEHNLEYIQDIVNALEDEEHKVTVDVQTSIDGLSLSTDRTSKEYRYVAPAIISQDILKTVDLNESITDLESFMSEDSSVPDLTNMELYYARLAGANKEELKIGKEEVKAAVEIKIKTIKNLILESLNQNIQSSLTDPENSSIGLEGIVFINPNTDSMFKVVNKEVFSLINNFNYTVRNNIKCNIKSVNPMLDISSRGGIYGEAKIRIAQIFNIEGIDLPRNQLKRFKQYMGDTQEQTINNIADTLELNEKAYKKKIIAILENAIEEIQELITDFKKDSQGYTMTVGNHTLTYNQEVIKRTLLFSAETINSIENLIDNVKGTKSNSDIITILYGPKINRLHEKI